VKGGQHAEKQLQACSSVFQADFRAFANNFNLLADFSDFTIVIKVIHRT